MQVGPGDLDHVRGAPHRKQLIRSLIYVESICVHDPRLDARLLLYV
jgi:hypothetical protein